MLKTKKWQMPFQISLIISEWDKICRFSLHSKSCMFTYIIIILLFIKPCKTIACFYSFPLMFSSLTLHIIPMTPNLLPTPSFILCLWPSSCSERRTFLSGNLVTKTTLVHGRLPWGVSSTMNSSWCEQSSGHKS